MQTRSRLILTALFAVNVCVQIGVNLAARSGIDPHLLSAIVENRREQLPESLQVVCEFTEAVIANAPQQDALRDQIR